VQVEQLDRTVALVGCLPRLVRVRARARVRVGSGSRQGAGAGAAARARAGNRVPHLLASRISGSISGDLRDRDASAAAGGAKGARWRARAVRRGGGAVAAACLAVVAAAHLVVAGGT
jgi:hypothetical protein